MPTADLNNSIVRGFAILDLFTPARPELNAATVARELGINAVTAHRFLKSLEHVGAIVAIRRGVYRLGYRLADLANRVGGDADIAVRLQPILNDLADRMNESALATRFDGRFAVCIATALSGRAVAFNARVGARFELHATANGKLWLADMDDAALSRHLETAPLGAFSGNTLTDRDALRAEIGRTRRRGYAVNDGEREDGLRAVAVPVRGRDGRMIAAMSVFGPNSRFDETRSGEAVQLLKAAAGHAEHALYGGSA